MVDIEGGRVIYYLGGSLAKLEKALKDGAKKVKDFGGEIKDNSKQIGLAFTAAGTAITGAFGLAVNSSNKFKTALAEISTLGVKDMAALEAGIQSIARTYGKDLTETAKGAYQVISATGLEAADANKVLALATEAATAGVSNVSAAVELGTGVMNAFGKGVDDLSGIYDQAFLAVKNGVTTFDELSASVGKLSPIFSAAGLSSEEMFAAVTALTKAGINTSEAVTGMKAAISNIVKPTKDALDTAKELGIQFDVSALKTKGLSTFMQELQEKTGGNVESMAKLFGSTEALNSMLALTGQQNKDFTGTLEESRQKAGQMKDALKLIIDNDPTFVWKQNAANMQVISNFIGTTLQPVLAQLAGGLKWVTDSLISLRLEHPKLADAITMIIGGGGAGLVGFGGLLLILPQVVTSVGLVSKAFLALKPILLTFETIPVVAALTGIAWALKELYDNWSWMWPEIKRIYWDVTRFISEKWEALKSLVADNPIVMNAFPFLSTLRNISEAVGNIIPVLDNFKSYLTTFSETATNAMNVLAEKSRSSWFKTYLNISNPIFKAITDMGIFDKFIEEKFGHSTWIDYFENLSSKAGLHFGKFQSVVSTALEMVRKALFDTTAILNGVAVDIDKGDGVSPALSRMLEKIEANTKAMESSKGAFGAYRSGLEGISTSARQAADAIAQVGDKIIGPGGWQQIKTDAESLFSGKLGGTTRAVSGSIQIEGTTLAGILTGAADQVKFSLSQILEASGQTFSDLYRDFMKYFHSQIELWQHGSEQVVLSVEEWANQIVQNSVGLQRALTSNFDTLAGAIDLTSDTIVESLKRVTSAIAETSRVTRTFSDPTGTGTRGFAAGGVTPHPIVKVGERGPELAALPVGTRIMSHSDMMSAVKGFASGGVVTVDAALRQLQSRLNNPGNLYVQGIGNTGSILTEIALNNYLWRYNQTHPVTSGAQDTGQRGYAEAMIQRNERIRQARIQDTSARASGSLSTGFSGIDAGLANRGTGSGPTINVNLNIDRVNASDPKDVDDFNKRVISALDKAIFGKLSAKGLSLNVGYTG